MTKTFLTEEENKLIEEISVDTKRRIVSFIKNKYCLELTNIDGLVQTIVKNVMVFLADSKNKKNGNMLKEAEKWYRLSGIKTEFHKHSIYGFSRSFDANNYTIIIPKNKLLTNVKYWLAIKIFKIIW